MKRKAIRVLIADDHPVVIEGLKSVLHRTARDIKVTCEARDGRQALEAASRGLADVYVLDVAMPHPNGLEVAARLSRSARGARAIMLSMHDDKPTVEKAMRSGARGYLVKETAAEEIAPAVRAVYGGDCYLSASLVRYFGDSGAMPASRFCRQPDEPELTEKERDIVGLIGDGLSEKEISARLGIAFNTVHVHRRNISRKLGIHKQTDLVRYAIREGLSRP
ncbi:MAG: response regulator transcription factor [Elusimicrobiales bacterium]|jgi:DNA-binding NarL/FixJ family response regulator|nr:response regulator transcription factor [Elusimicrobiales bacterium]